MGHARALLGTPDRAFQEQLAKRAVAEDLSVREVEEAIRAREDDAGRRRGRPARARPKLRPPGLLELEELLGDYLETRVQDHDGRRAAAGSQIDFANLEDLERIYRVMTEGQPPAERGLTGSGRRRRAVPRRRGGCRRRARRARSGHARRERRRRRPGSSRETSSHTTAAIRVSRRRR